MYNMAHLLGNQAWQFAIRLEAIASRLGKYVVHLPHPCPKASRTVRVGLTRFEPPLSSVSCGFGSKPYCLKWYMENPRLHLRVASEVLFSKRTKKDNTS